MLRGPEFDAGPLSIGILFKQLIPRLTCVCPGREGLARTNP